MLASNFRPEDINMVVFDAAKCLVCEAETGTLFIRQPSASDQHQLTP